MAELAPWEEETAPWDEGKPKNTVISFSNNPLSNTIKGLYGLAEAGTNIVTGAGASAVGGLRGANALLAGEGMDEATRRIQETQNEYTWRPRTEHGKAAVEIAAAPFEAAGKGGGYVGKVLGQSLSGEAPTSEKSQRWGDTGELVGKVGTEAVLTVAGGRPVLKAAPKIAEAVTNPLGAPGGYSTVPANLSRQKASKLDVLQTAENQGFTIPAKESVGRATLQESVAGGSEIDHIARQKNQTVANRKVLNDVLGEPDAFEITPDVIARAETRAMEPRREIEQLGPIPLKGDAEFTARAGNLDELAGLSSDVKALMEKAPEATAKIARLRDTAQNMDSITGNEAMRVISDLRQQSSDTLFGGNRINEAERAIAQAQRRLSDALENRIERHLQQLGNVDLLNRFTEGRTHYAQIQDLKAATNRITGNVDPTLLAEGVQNGGILTGPLRDMADIAGHAPNVMMSVDRAGNVAHNSYHGTTAGTRVVAGHVAGTPGIVGTVLGKTLIRPYLQKRVLSPEWIAKHRLQDNRPLRERMGVQEHVNPPELQVMPPGELPPSSMGGTVVGEGPNTGGVINLAPQLDTGLPSPGMGPQAVLRRPSYREVRGGSAQFDSGAPTPQMPAVEMPLQPKPGNTPLYERGGVPEAPPQPFSFEQPYPGVEIPFVPEAPLPPWPRPPANYSSGPEATMAALRGNKQPTPPTPQMPAVEIPLTPEMANKYLSDIMEAMNRGDMETANRLEAQYQAAQEALQSQSPHPAHNLLYEPFRNRPGMPPPPSGPSAFSEALRNFRGAQ